MSWMTNLPGAALARLFAAGGCGGCQANINLKDNFEEGVGGHGGYGAFYCFALDT